MNADPFIRVGTRDGLDRVAGAVVAAAPHYLPLPIGFLIALASLGLVFLAIDCGHLGSCTFLASHRQESRLIIIDACLAGGFLSFLGHPVYLEGAHAHSTLYAELFDSSFNPFALAPSVCNLHTVDGKPTQERG